MVSIPPYIPTTHAETVLASKFKKRCFSGHPNYMNEYGHKWIFLGRWPMSCIKGVAAFFCCKLQLKIWPNLGKLIHFSYHIVYLLWIMILCRRKNNVCLNVVIIYLYQISLILKFSLRLKWKRKTFLVCQQFEQCRNRINLNGLDK